MKAASTVYSLSHAIGIFCVLLALLLSCACQAYRSGRSTTAAGATGSSDTVSTHEASSSEESSSQVLDSVTSTLVPTTGGIAELPGFASVRFSEGAFDSGRVVKLAATSEERERGLFGASVGTTPAAHEVRINTGSSAPATPVAIAVTVPREFLDLLPSNKVPVLFARERVMTEYELYDEYALIGIDFDAAERVVKARLSPEFFEEFQIGEGVQAVIMISSAIRR